jgi:Glycosyl transferase family 2
VTATGVSVVIPTLGRPALADLLAALAAAGPAPLPVEVLVVDDRPDRGTPLATPPGVTVLAGRAAGPAAARNTGWRAARHEWVAFLDDDVLPGADWLRRLADDLAGAGAQVGGAPVGAAQVGGVQGRVRVPLPAGRRPTDWERVTAGLAEGRWITADMAYRRAALEAVGGFDERLPRAFREDAELAYRVRRAGWALVRGRRGVTHPVRPEGRWVSVRTQRGNADDALLRRLYGPGWRDVVGVPPGRRHRHAAVTAAAAVALGCAVVGAAARDRRWLAAAALAGAGWAAGTAEFAATRIAPGPRDRGEIATMLTTSAVIPPVATAHWLRGWLRWRGARPLPAAPPPPPSPAASRPGGATRDSPGHPAGPGPVAGVGAPAPGHPARPGPVAGVGAPAPAGVATHVGTAR